MMHGQCRRPVRISCQGINLFQQFTDDDGRRLHTVVAGAGTGITDIERRTGAAQDFQKCLPILIATVSVTHPGLETHTVESICAFPTGEMVAIHPQKTDQPRRHGTAMCQRRKGYATTHETPSDRVPNTPLHGIAQHRQRQRGRKPGNQAVTRKPGEALAKPHHVIHLGVVQSKEAIQNLMANRYPTRQRICPGQSLAKRNQLF